jgi:hypothetical protein
MALRSDQVTAGDVVRRQHRVIRWRTRLHPEWMTCRPPGGLKAWAGAGAAGQAWAQWASPIQMLFEFSKLP